MSALFYFKYLIVQGLSGLFKSLVPAARNGFERHLVKIGMKFLLYLY